MLLRCPFCFLIRKFSVKTKLLIPPLSSFLQFPLLLLINLLNHKWLSDLLLVNSSTTMFSFSFFFFSLWFLVLPLNLCLLPGFLHIFNRSPEKKNSLSRNLDRRRRKNRWLKRRRLVSLTIKPPPIWSAFFNALLLLFLGELFLG